MRANMTTHINLRVPSRIQPDMGRHMAVLVIGLVLMACGDNVDTLLPMDAGSSTLPDSSPIPERDGGSSPVDSGVIPSCPEDIEPSCETAVFRDCESRNGTNGAALIKGTIILESGVICDGDLLIDKTSAMIICSGTDCSNEPLAEDASIICADVVLPGLIDAHNHMSYNTLPPWRSGGRLFQNRNQWRSLIGPDLYDARPPRNDAIAARFSELRLLLSGTTSVHKAEDTRSSHAHVRNIDRANDAHGLGYDDSAFRECVFPFTSSCSQQPNYEENTDIPERAFVAHVAEGIDEDSRREFAEFSTDSRLGAKTAIIHCTACSGEQLAEMKTTDTKLIWSPQSNIALYGQTTDVASALRMDLTIALGPDWTPSGTMNMLTEAKCAKQVSDEYWDHAITNQRLVRMMTSDAARSLGVFDQIGSIEPGKLADIILIAGDRRRPYGAVVEANPVDIQAVFIDGALQLSDSETFNEDLARNEFCEIISMCDTEKYICVKDIAGEPNRFDRADWARFGFYDIVNYVETIVQNQKPGNLPPELDYAYEVHPLFECVPTYDCALGNETVSGSKSEEDRDGDGLINEDDNCPDVFNPWQDNIDQDDKGDACDPCPWAFPNCPCTAPTGPDRDNDGVLDNVDNCPAVSNPDQSDLDGDALGDLCDLCPEQALSDVIGCPVAISSIKRNEIPLEELVETEGTVTGVYGQHLSNSSVGSFFIQSGESSQGYDGLFVYMGDRSTSTEIPNVGERIKVTAKVTDFFGQLQLNGVRRIETVSRSVILPTDEVLSRLDGREAEMESQLICLYDLTTADVTPEPGAGDSEPTFEFVVEDEDAAYSIRVNDALYRTSPLPSIGTHFERICGVYHLANGDYKIEPRDEADLDTGPSRVIGVGPVDTFLRTNEKRVPTNEQGRKLNIQLSKEAPEQGLLINLNTDDPTLARVPNTLQIPPGTRNFPLVVEAFGGPGSVNVSINTDGAADTHLVPVQILSADASPQSLNLTTDKTIFVAGDLAQLTIALDQPAPYDIRVSLLASDNNALQVPEMITIRRNQSTSVVSLRTTLPSDSVRIDAKAGALRGNVELSIVAPQPNPIISEVNADMSDVESLEYVELFNPSVLPFSTAGLALSLINGGSDPAQAYETYDLSSLTASWPPRSFIVVGDVGVEALLPEGTLFLPWTSNGNDHDIQNGDPDGVQLSLNGEAIDGMSYGGVILGTTEGETGAPDDLNTDDGAAISRCPFDSDSNQNHLDFALRPGTPGQPNDCSE